MQVISKAVIGFLVCKGLGWATRQDWDVDAVVRGGGRLSLNGLGNPWATHYRNVNTVCPTIDGCGSINLSTSTFTEGNLI